MRWGSGGAFALGHTATRPRRRKISLAARIPPYRALGANDGTRGGRNPHDPALPSYFPKVQKEADIGINVILSLLPTHQRWDGFFEWSAEFFQRPGKGFARGFDGEGGVFGDFAEAGVGEASGFEEVQDFAGVAWGESDDDAGLGLVEEGDVSAGSFARQASAIVWPEVGWEGIE